MSYISLILRWYHAIRSREPRRFFYCEEMRRFQSELHARSYQLRSSGSSLLS